MNKFTSVLRRAGLQTDKTLVTVESLHQIVAETSVPFQIFPTVFGGPAIGRIVRIYVEDDELRGDVELNGPCCKHSKADDWTCSEACYPCDPGCCPQVDESATSDDEEPEPDDTASDPQPPASR